MTDEKPQDDRWEKRYRWHIGSIPELMMLTRQALVPLKATAYGERVQGGGDVRRLPLNGDAVDEADLLWALLVIYAREVAYNIGGSSPSCIRDQVWSNNSEPQGLPGGVTSSGAFVLGRIVSNWLQERCLTIAEFDGLQESEDQLFAYVRSLRSRYGVQDTTDRKNRFCGVCLSYSVTTQFEDVGGVEFTRTWCTHCGNEVEGVRRVGNAHIPAGRATRGPVGEDDQTVEATRPRDGA